MIGDARVLAVIPARGGSKGLPRKNLIPFLGRPLIAWTIEAAKGSRRIDRVILSSDDAEIIETAQGLGCEAPFVRPATLATDEATSLDVVLDAVDRTPGYDVVVLLQPTSPLRTAEDIDGVLDLLEGADSAVSVTDATDHPFLVYRPGADGRLTAYAEAAPGASLRRQDLPPAWSLNGAVYAARVDWLRRERAFVRPGQTLAWPMPAARSADIDTLADLIEAERSAET
jgi:CMP-N,N'-diacetyllegionaminic acid synthase